MVRHGFGMLSALLMIWGCLQFAGSAMAGEELSMRYYFSTESTYREIVVKNNTFTITYFNDTSGRCSHWVMQAPCWDKKDLKTVHAKLTPDDMSNLVNLVHSSEFFVVMNNDNPPEGIRYYPEILEVKIGEQAKTFTHMRRPDGPKPPAAFSALLDALLVKEAEIMKQQSSISKVHPHY